MSITRGRRRPMVRKRSPRKRQNSNGDYLLCEQCDIELPEPSWCPLCGVCWLEDLQR